MKKQGIFSAIKTLWIVGSTKDRFVFIFLLFGAIIRAVAALVAPLITACIVSKIAGEPAGILSFYFPEDMSLFSVCLYCFALYFGLQICSTGIRVLIRLFATNMKTKTNVYALKLVLTYRKNFDIKMTNGEASYIIKSASENVDIFIESGLVEIICPLLSAIFAFSYIASLNPMTLTVISVTLLLFVCAMKTRVYLDGKVYKKLENINGQINNHVLNNLENLSFIGFLKSRKTEIGISKNLNQEFFKTDKKRILVYTLYWLFIYIVEFVSALLVVWLVLNQNLNSVQILSILIIIIPYILNIFSYLDNFGAVVGQCQRYGIAISRISLVKAAPQDIIQQSLPTESKNLISIEKLPQDLVINKLHVTNMKIDIGQLHMQYDAVFEKGKINCIIGESGHGKTTMIKAMLGLLESTDGYIVVNDQYKLNNLFFENDKISICFQENNLLDRSIMDNVLYPNHDYDQTVKHLLRTFNLEKIVAREDLNFKNKLSGGEKKRLNFIRCVSQKANIYILDEPTNDLDEKNVKKVLNVLSKLKKDAIVIVISHDNRVFEKADNIVLI